MLDTAAVLPTQEPFCQPTPVTIFTFSLFDNFANAVLALLYEAAHVPAPLPEVPDPDGGEALEVLEELRGAVVPVLDFVTELVAGFVVEVAFVLVASVVDAAPGRHWK